MLPKLIVIEGIDGTGKSTMASELAKWLESHGRTVVLDKQPTSTGPHGIRLREAMVTGDLSPVQQMELFIADRAWHNENVIQPAMERGEIVILDRYYFSNMAYQGQQGFDPDEVRARNEQLFPLPDLAIVLDLDPETALSRCSKRGEEKTIYESLENLKGCREVFLGLAGEPMVEVVSAKPSFDLVFYRVKRLVNNRLALGLAL